MITYRIGDLLAQPDLTHIAHQANLYHTFGSGIARSIKERFPDAYKADLATPYGKVSKLGTWSLSPGNPVLINLYTQRGISSVDRCTSYVDMDKAFTSLSSFLASLNEPIRLGIPYKIGCGLGGGDWEVVEAMLLKHFGQSPIDLIICRLPNV